MPTFETDGWELDNAEEKNLTYPDQFEIPSLEERRSVKVGQKVKLLFLFQLEEEGRPVIQCERMWVRLVRVSVDRYEGKLLNKPYTSKLLRVGSVITFGPEHIATVLIPKTDPRHPDYKKNGLMTLLRNILGK